MSTTSPTVATFTQLLAQAGVTINGTNPWDIQVHSPRFYQRILRNGTLGAGESYMAGEWDCESIDEMVFRLIRADLGRYIGNNPRQALRLLTAKVVNSGRKSKAFEVGEKHYDIGNELYRRMLDSRMVYSCGYWKDAKNLEEAQEAKLDLICRKLYLKKGMRVLDIGGGWGGLSRFMAERYGVSVVAVTISKEQKKLADEFCAGLPVEFRLQDYRDVNEQFDRVVSVGMFEHVAAKNYRTYMDVVHRCLHPDGLSLLHTITGNTSDGGFDPWIEKYIFPNAVIPSLRQIATAAEGRFIIEDVHNFGSDYDTTLMAWHQNFEDAWPDLKKAYDETFHRMWRLYLLSCAGSFRARFIGLTQTVLSPNGVVGGYQPVR